MPILKSLLSDINSSRMMIVDYYFYKKQTHINVKRFASYIFILSNYFGGKSPIKYFKTSYGFKIFLFLVHIVRHN